MAELSKDGAEESDNSGSGGSVFSARSRRGVGEGGAWRSSLQRRVQRAKSHGHRSRGHGNTSQVGEAAKDSSGWISLSAV